MTKAMTLGTKQLMWTVLLPASKYNTELRVTVPPGKSPTDLTCNEIHTIGQYYPFRGFPDGAQVQVPAAWDANGNVTQKSAWLFGSRKLQDEIWFNPPPASIVDPLFKSVADGGLGLARLPFIGTAGFTVLDYTGGIPREMQCRWG